MVGQVKAIRWKTKALRQLRKIKDVRARERIYDNVGNLKSFPDCKGVKKLKGRDEYRLRVDRWRVIFTDSLEIIEIQEVKIRDGHTY
ncbi:MAG: type II toxin-antitoxin system RelE/ParE family toxin [Desulfobacterales bacterium]|nr:type II toxin-antitoxin system RelE/ParE family toxin [Desulfobacterales bacterium]